MTLDFIIKFKLIEIVKLHFHPITYIIQTNLKGFQRTTKRYKNISSSFFDNFNLILFFQIPITISILTNKNKSIEMKWS